ncbi:Calcineurin-like phosphoesterase [Mesonia phycicola]|uniref:acid phosphatase n=1 Tax=Mesonia phycicola TaxID=579105 RepID=A0A1M6CMR8_9FLAO|nr:metallophosphoesterase [Mesonia phycicola]SHI62213.1 Calcineurin-like phosphoesterase [Mesonia phycicola]
MIYQRLLKLNSFLFIGVFLCSLNILAQKKYYNDNENSNLKELQVEEDGLHFYVIGDWGRNGHFKQAEVADIMQQAGFILEPEFIISVGDNFYPNGIASVNDPYLKSSFEDIYYGSNLFCPWYVAIGNHGYRGNVQAQIDYSKISQRWTMPDRYFKVEKTLEDDKTTAKFIFLDTNTFEDDYYESEKYAKVKEQDSSKQKKWLEKTLKNSTADWNIVIGHHPLYTSGKRVNDEPYVRNHLEKIFEKYKVPAYFAGHEHDIQHLKPKKVFTHHFISGAGSDVRPTGESDFTQFSKSEQGFLIVSLLPTKMLVQAVNWKGEITYKYEIPK